MARRLGALSRHVVGASGRDWGRQGDELKLSREYVDRALGMMAAIREDAPSSIAALAQTCAAAIRGSRTVYASMVEGHMPHDELADERVGNPRHFERPSNSEELAELFDTLEPGDVVLTQTMFEQLRELRDRGVIVVVVTTCYVVNASHPPGQVTNENGSFHPPRERGLVPDPMPEDVASIVLDTHIP